MLFNLSGEKTRASVNISSSGDNILIPAITDGEIHVSQLLGGPDGAVTVTIKCGSRTVGVYNLSAGESITETSNVDQPGEPRFKCYQGENFIVNLSAATPFTGSVEYSYKR